MSSEMDDEILAKMPEWFQTLQDIYELTEGVNENGRNKLVRDNEF